MLWPSWCCRMRCLVLSALSVIIPLCVFSVIRNEVSLRVFASFEGQTDAAWSLQSTGMSSTIHSAIHHATTSGMTMEEGNNSTANSTLLVPPTKDDLIQPSLNASFTNVSVSHFHRYEGVVIATKIHGPHQFSLAAQSLCLLHKAYNDRMNYDMLVFTTLPLSEKETTKLAELVAPANLTVVVDNPGLQAMIANLTDTRRQQFLKRCKVDSPEKITWWSECPGRIAYNWQAEFRSLHIWNHPALANYQYMLWMDSDGFPTRPWNKDPVAHMIAHDLVIFFDHFPQGKIQGKVRRTVLKRIHKAFNNNKTLCKLKVTKEGGWFQPTYGTVEKCAKKYKEIPLIHGFLHITNLNFFRSEEVLKWQEIFIGDCFLCRHLDDQMAVTIPAAMLAPHRARDMRRSAGLKLKVFHNGVMDGQHSEKVGGFLRYWRKFKKKFPPSFRQCPVKNTI